MGNLFENINDRVVISEYISFYDECHVCGRKNKIIFRACGYEAGENSDSCPDQPYLGTGVGAACIDCIKSGKIIPFGEKKFTEFLKKNFSNWKELRDSLRKTPHIPSMAHGLDWPVCCHTLTEFSGFPKYSEEVREFVQNSYHWSNYSNNKLNINEESNEYLSDIFMFRCKNCGKKYWIYQETL